MPFLLPNQQHQSTEGKSIDIVSFTYIILCIGLCSFSALTLLVGRQIRTGCNFLVLACTGCPGKEAVKRV